MGQLLLLVVAAAWAAVLLPPLLRSRVENRPNSSVSDFRDQLSRLQRAMPTRGVAVRTMGRPLAPSTLSRPAANGRPGQPASARSHGAVSSRLPSKAPAGRPSRAESRMHEASLRSRQHGVGAPESSPRITRAGDPTAELKRRRANVLFVLVLTAVCAGFLAATTDSKAMVYVFALAMLALGGYVYLLVTLNQREILARGYDIDEYDDRASRRSAARLDDLDDLDDFDDVDDADGFDDHHDDVDEYPVDDRRVLRPVARQRQARQQPVRRQQLQYGELPGSGVSGRISYGRGPATRQPVARDPFAAAQAQRTREPCDPYGREGYGWESAGRDAGRRTPARNGRHATGQQQAVRGRQPQTTRRGSAAQAG